MHGSLQWTLANFDNECEAMTYIKQKYNVLIPNIPKYCHITLFFWLKVYIGHHHLFTVLGWTEKGQLEMKTPHSALVGIVEKTLVAKNQNKLLECRV